MLLFIQTVAIFSCQVEMIQGGGNIDII